MSCIENLTSTSLTCPTALVPANVAKVPDGHRPEKVARAKAVKNAIAITRMEGGEPSAFCLELLAFYVSGDITGAEMQERMLRHVRGQSVDGDMTGTFGDSA